jgi:predicted hydrocarbon binding protein
MQRIEQSGFKYPNLVVNVILLTFNDILGKNGLATALKYAGLDEYINNYPESNLEPGGDFAEMSSLFQAIEEIYGARGSHALLTRVGRMTLASYRNKFAPMMAFFELELKLMSNEKKIKHALDYVMKMLTRTGNQEVVSSEDGAELVYQISKCSTCFGRPRVDHPVCHMTVGLMQEILHWVTDGQDFQVKEILCIAKGDPFCEFRVATNPIISIKVN